MILSYHLVYDFTVLLDTEMLVLLIKFSVAVRKIQTGNCNDTTRYNSDLNMLKRSYQVDCRTKLVTHVQTHACMHTCTYTNTQHISRLTIVSREAKKKQAVRDEQVCYLQVTPL